jgi:hypothetical protein
LPRLAQGLQSYDHDYGRAREWADVCYNEEATGRAKERNDKIFSKYWARVNLTRKLLVGVEKFDEPTEPKTGLMADLRDALRDVADHEGSGSAKVRHSSHISSPPGAVKQE